MFKQKEVFLLNYYFIKSYEIHSDATACNFSY